MPAARAGVNDMDTARTRSGKTMRPPSIRVMIADDHPAVLIGVAHELSADPLVCVVGSARSPSGLLALLETTACDVLITDYVMPDDRCADGSRLLERIRRQHPGLGIVVYTMQDNPAILASIFRDGIRCIVSKADEPRHLLAAVTAARTDARYLSPAITRHTDEMEDGLNTTAVADLSRREAEVLRLYISGMTINEIAAQLHRSKQTISAQKVTAMRKLGVRQDADLFRYAIGSGLVAAPHAAPGPLRTM